MEETRTSLAEKIETLEKEVVETVAETTHAVTDTVETVKEAVEGTVETVKDTVEDTVEAVKRTFDISEHVRRRPWLCMGASVALGFIGGKLFLRGMQRVGREPKGFVSPSMTSRPSGPAFYEREERPAAAPTAPAEQKPGWLSSLGEKFGSEIRQLKGLALGTALGLARDALAKSAPEEIRPRVIEIANNITEKLGGQVIHEPLLKSNSDDQGQHQPA
jgi:ElaB/YqjD/DUF883 family membrane-anchored ribosome-binding protein